MAARPVVEVAFESDHGLATNGPGYSISTSKYSRKEATQGKSTILAIGTSVPRFPMEQEQAIERFVQDSGIGDDMELVEKLQRVAKTSGVKTRYFHFNNGEFIKENPELMQPEVPSIHKRMLIANDLITTTLVDASRNAIREWGRPVSDITHLVYVSSSEFRIPGGDYILSQILGLNNDVNRVLLYHLGCYAGVAGLRVAKDLAENNPGSRVLIATADTVIPGYRVLNPNRPGDLVASVLFGDGGSATILGTDPIPTIERPWFEIDYAGQSLVPGTESVINGILKETGIFIDLGKEVPKVIEDNVSHFCDVILRKAGKSSLTYNDLFYAVHPGGPAILTVIEAKLQLTPEKLASSRQILQDYGNMNCSTVFFVLDYIRKTTFKRREANIMDDPEWGLIIAFGPGITMEGVLARNLA